MASVPAAIPVRSSCVRLERASGRAQMRIAHLSVRRQVPGCTLLG